MAELLYRIGRLAARRAWLVISGWVVLLVLAIVALIVFGGALTTSVTIPGTETEKVTAQLKEEIPGLGGAAATVVFQSEDGTAITEAQQAEVATVLTEVAAIDGVDSVVDPFAAAAARAAQEQKLADGTAALEDAQAKTDAALKAIPDAHAQLDAGEAAIDTAEAALDAAQAGLDAAQAQLDATIAQAQANGTYDALKERFDQQQAQLDQKQAQLDQRLTQIDQGRAEIDSGHAALETTRQQLEDGQVELDATREQLQDAQTLADAASEIQTVSDDGSVAVAYVVFEDDLLTLSPEVRGEVADVLDAAAIDGVTVDYSSVIAASLEGLIGVGEVIGVILAFLVLIVMFRALLPALLPIVSSLVAVGVGVAGSLAFSGVIEMSAVTPVLGIMLGLAVGIDYTLFIVSRHRGQLLAGMEVRESVALANGTSGNAVVFAGSTVIVALLALNITGIPFLGVMGTVGAVCILVAVLVAVSLTPALLSLLGVRVLSRGGRAQIGHAAHARPELRPMKTWRAILTAIATIIVLLVIAIPSLSMRLGLPDASSEPVDSTQYKAYTAVEEAFGAGQNGPLVVTAELAQPVAEGDALSVQADLVAGLMRVEGVVAVAPIGVSEDQDFFAFQVIPTEGPSSESTEELVHTLRDMSPVDTDHGEVVLGVAGQASGNIDISAKLAAILPIYLVVVIGLSLLILILVFRSILVPIFATLGFVLSLFAALGAVTAVYQWGWLGGIFGVHNPGPVLNFAPLIIMGVLFGLAMDYQLFLVTGMREAYVHGAPARVAVAAGVRSGRAVVTAAAIIMIAVFGGFVFSHITMVRPIGFGLAFGVLVDAFVVRLLLIPALMHLLGRSAWWLPRWLDKILPNVDVEGAALERSHPPVPDAAAEGSGPDVGEGDAGAADETGNDT